MEGRPHGDRLLSDLKDIRKELLGELRGIQPEEFDWAPKEGMKSFKALVVEIATMEELCAGLAATGDTPEWEAVDEGFRRRATSPEQGIAVLEEVRSKTNRYLGSTSEEKLETAVPVPAEWQQYLGEQIEPEELIRWIAKHEYYHLGQIISYRWIQGHDPYKE